jgi:hypothetical protein
MEKHNPATYCCITIKETVQEREREETSPPENKTA